VHAPSYNRPIHDCYDSTTPRAKAPIWTARRQPSQLPHEAVRRVTGINGTREKRSYRKSCCLFSLSLKFCPWRVSESSRGNACKHLLKRTQDASLCVLLPSKDHARTGVRVQAGCRVSARMLQEHPRVERGASLADSRRINENPSRGDAACGRRDEPAPHRSHEDLDELCVRSGGSVVPKRRRA
jgi:hypothetical protein